MISAFTRCGYHNLEVLSLHSGEDHVCKCCQSRDSNRIANVSDKECVIAEELLHCASLVLSYHRDELLAHKELLLKLRCEDVFFSDEEVLYVCSCQDTD